MLKRAVAGMLSLVLAWLCWVVWQAPRSAMDSQPVVVMMPERPGDYSGLWRVVTRRFIVPEAAGKLRSSLLQQGFPAIELRHQEEVELYAFDDPRSFATHEDAARVRDAWKQAGFEAQISKPDGKFGVSLGRLYLEAYARQLQRRLEGSKRPYTYHRRQVTIPTWRYTFPAMAYTDAQTLWLRVQAMGMADPVLMQEPRFQDLYGDILTGKQGTDPSNK